HHWHFTGGVDEIEMEPEEFFPFGIIINGLNERLKIILRDVNYAAFGGNFCVFCANFIGFSSLSFTDDIAKACAIEIGANFPLLFLNIARFIDVPNSKQKRIERRMRKGLIGI